MIKIILRNSATIEGLNSAEILMITSELTIPNPAFNMRMERGLSLWGIGSHLLYVKNLGGNTLEIPIGALPNVIKKLDREISITDKRTAIKNDYFSDKKMTVTLRDYQKEAVDILLTKTVGCLEAKTGSGKTVCLTSLIIERGVNSLILVNTTELLNQTRAAIAKATNIPLDEIGIIGAGKYNLKPVTVGMHQTLCTLPDETFVILNAFFSQVLADEAHICPAKTYYNNLFKLTAKYKHGFSGTLQGRSDGLDKVIYFSTGPRVHTVSTTHLQNILVAPKVKFINTNYFFPLFSSEEYQIMMSDLGENRDRNELIVKIITETYFDKYGCFLCLRLNQVDALKKMLGADAVILTSKMTKKERIQVMKDIHLKKYRWVISTYGLFSTGIDIPHLDLLVLAAPIKSLIKLKQSAGRIMRQSPGKLEAHILDFVDVRIDLLKNQARGRKRILENL